jgi:hypothetical protein
MQTLELLQYIPGYKKTYEYIEWSVLIASSLVDMAQLQGSLLKFLDRKGGLEIGPLPRVAPVLAADMAE